MVSKTIGHMINRSHDQLILEFKFEIRDVTMFLLMVQIRYIQYKCTHAIAMYRFKGPQRIVEHIDLAEL